MRKLNKPCNLAGNIIIHIGPFLQRWEPNRTCDAQNRVALSTDVMRSQYCDGHSRSCDMVVDNEDVGGHKHHHAGSAMYDNITYVEKRGLTTVFIMTRSCSP